MDKELLRTHLSRPPWGSLFLRFSSGTAPFCQALVTMRQRAASPITYRTGRGFLAPQQLDVCVASAAQPTLRRSRRPSEGSSVAPLRRPLPVSSGSVNALASKARARRAHLGASSHVPRGAARHSGTDTARGAEARSPCGLAPTEIHHFQCSLSSRALHDQGGDGYQRNQAPNVALLQETVSLV